MTPEAAVARLVEIIAADDGFTEDSLYAAMAEAGIPARVADRAYKFTQTAWGRVFLDGMGIHFSADYFCFDAAGDVMESGLLAEQPYFVAAMRLATQAAKAPGFPKFAVMSADVNAVNSALNSGSQPENLVMVPAAFFMEPPTPVGMDKAHQLLSRLLSERSGGPKLASEKSRGGSSGDREVEDADWPQANLVPIGPRLFSHSQPYPCRSA